MKQDNVGDYDYPRKFYSNNKFKFVSFEDTNSMQKLKFCSNCNILRPPRAFHCNKSRMCVEGYEFHNTWVGTTIGKRNSWKYTGLLMALFYHSFVSVLIVVGTLDILYSIHAMWTTEMIALAFLLCDGLFLTFLFGFLAFNRLCSRSFKNVTTYEVMRKQWNGRADLNSASL